MVYKGSGNTGVVSLWSCLLENIKAVAVVYVIREMKCNLNKKYTCLIYIYIYIYIYILESTVTCLKLLVGLACFF